MKHLYKTPVPSTRKGTVERQVKSNPRNKLIHGRHRCGKGRNARGIIFCKRLEPQSPTPITGPITSSCGKQGIYLKKDISGKQSGQLIHKGYVYTVYQWSIMSRIWYSKDHHHPNRGLQRTL